MFLLLLTSIVTTTASINNDPVANQLKMFRQTHPFPIGIMTTGAGRPLPYSEATNTLNTRLVFNEYLMDSLTHHTRERLPERVVHAKAGGAFGYFQVTHDISHICKARLFSRVGKKTQVAVRFSPIVVERGGSDVSRDARGFAVKFYTDDGNLDIVGFNQPVFVVKDPLLFPSFVHSQKKNPVTNLYDANTFWDFLTLHPESFNLFLRLFGDSGIPNGYGNMPGFSIHTFQLENSRGDVYYARFHFIPDAGIKSLTAKEAREIEAIDPDYNTRNLYSSIGKGIFPSWTVSLQVVTAEQIKFYGFDYIFDVTRTISLKSNPLTKVGKLILNKNSLNYFAQLEQLAFNPGNLVPGIYGAPDGIFEARLIAYRDALYNRLGANFNKINVNCPLNEVFAYNRDGLPPLDNNQWDSPSYFPNSFNSPIPYIESSQPLIIIIENEPNNFDQMTELYIDEMTMGEKSRVVENIVCSLSQAASFLQDRAVKIFTRIHPDLGARIRDGLLANKNKTL